ncbi:MAG: hypothetical protein JNL40_02420 [Cyclobacteriaceae bacterium]|nr:hypothetical protein [Cyclobacteriaceae bacterium]
MDDQQIPSAPGSAEVKIELNRDALFYLLNAGKWAKFLAILGFIFIGFLVILGFAAGSLLSSVSRQSALPFPSYLFGLIYLIIGAIYFFPVHYLYNFASLAYSGIRDKDSSKIGQAILNLKSHYKFLGILAIVSLALYIFVLFIILAVGAGQFLGNSVNT